MNERVLYNRYYEKFSGFRNAVFGFLENLLDPPEDLKEALLQRVTDKLHLIETVLIPNK